MTIEQMAVLAQTALAPVEHTPNWLPCPLAYILVTESGAVHTVINDDFGDTIQSLQESGDTAVQKVLAMWKDGWADLPSYAFRTALLDLDPANAATELVGTRQTLDATMFHG